MVAATFDEALRRLLAHEGGYADHPSDPGGPTNFGITIHDYRKYVKPDATAADVRAMQVSEAKAIYRDKYWHVLRCDDLPAGLDYAAFDYGVNSGVARAAKVLQRLLGLPDTGRMSDAVIAAVKTRSAADLVARLCDERLAFLKGLRTWPVFGAGWGRRVAEVRRTALAMAKGVRDAAAPSKAQGRGHVPVSNPARNATAAGVVVAGGGAAQTAHQAGMGWPAVAACLVVAGAIAVAVWIGWRWWRERRQAAPAKAQMVTALLREKLKGWKTVVFGAALTGSSLVADVLEALQFIDLAPLLPPAYAVKIIAAIGIATIILRLATTGRVGQKDL